MPTIAHISYVSIVFEVQLKKGGGQKGRMRVKEFCLFQTLRLIGERVCCCCGSRFMRGRWQCTIKYFFLFVVTVEVSMKVAVSGLPREGGRSHLSFNFVVLAAKLLSIIFVRM